jgi:hypothetical protein
VKSEEPLIADGEQVIAQADEGSAVAAHLRFAVVQLCALRGGQLRRVVSLWRRTTEVVAIAD